LQFDKTADISQTLNSQLAWLSWLFFQDFLPKMKINTMPTFEVITLTRGKQMKAKQFDYHNITQTNSIIW
jgi:hypothetical protein